MHRLIKVFVVIEPEPMANYFRSFNRKTFQVQQLTKRHHSYEIYLLLLILDASSVLHNSHRQAKRGTTKQLWSVMMMFHQHFRKANILNHNASYLCEWINVQNVTILQAYNWCPLIYVVINLFVCSQLGKDCRWQLLNCWRFLDNSHDPTAVCKTRFWFQQVVHCHITISLVSFVFWMNRQHKKNQR